MADERDLTVRLPYQRGQSLDTLRGLDGRERLWPLVPSRQEDLKAMAAAAMQAGWGRVMVVEDPSALESTSSNAFVELFNAAGGIVESYEAQSVQRVDPSNDARLQRFKDDMAWSWVGTVVVADAPNGPLSQELRAEQQQGRFGGGAWCTAGAELDLAQRGGGSAGCARGALPTAWAAAPSLWCGVG